jgi:hypothetical protein
MKATKFFRLKAEWEKIKQSQQPVVVQEPVKVVEEKKTEPVKETIAPTVEEVKQQEPPPVSKILKKKTTNVE